MKKYILLLLGMPLFIAGCSKKDHDHSCDQNNQDQNVKAESSFRISNQLSEGKILEGNILDIVNESKNAVSYEWNFGNGIQSTTTAPTDVSYVPCGGHYSITLKATDIKGHVSVSTHEYEIMCRGRNANGKHVHDPNFYPVIHINGQALQAYQSH